MELYCCDPLAPIDKCFVCGKVVHTCERDIPLNNDYRCSVHKDDIQDDDSRWFCGIKCYNIIYRE